MLPTREGQRHGMAPRARPGDRPERPQPVAWLALPAARRAGAKEGFGSCSLLVPEPRREASRRAALSMSAMRGCHPSRAAPADATLKAAPSARAAGPVYKPPPRSQMSARCVISCSATRASGKTRFPTLIESRIQSGELFRVFPFSGTRQHSPPSLDPRPGFLTRCFTERVSKHFRTEAHGNSATQEADCSSSALRVRS